jgi:hypothetical protein
MHLDRDPGYQKQVYKGKEYGECLLHFVYMQRKNKHNVVQIKTVFKDDSANEPIRDRFCLLFCSVLNKFLP